MKVRFSVNCPKRDKREIERGEDAPPVSEDGIMIICDGTGATGQSEHEISGGKYREGIYTSAYLGSRETSELAKKYLRENYNEIMRYFPNSNSEDLKVIVQGLGNKIQEGLDAFRNENHLKRTVLGKSFKLLPTTFTAVVYKVSDDCVEAIVLCAGDSHALWWDCERGLCQLSFDDNGMEDGIAEGDCKISNCISADSDFRINYLCHRLPPKGILVVTSDGFTDPITFFEQERFLVKWIRDSGAFSEITEPNVEKLSDAILRQIDDIGFSRRDDCSLSGAIVGYQNSRELIEAIDKRLTSLELDYFQPFQELKKNRIQLEQTIKETEENTISAIQKEIVKFTDCPKLRTYDPQFQRLLSADTVRPRKEELDSKIQKETEELQKEINDLTLQMHEQYKVFLKKLLLLPIKVLAKQQRFPRNLIYAAKQCACDGEESESLLFQYTDSLNEIKRLPEIRNEDQDIISHTRRVKSLCLKLVDLCERLETYNSNASKIKEFFDDNSKISRYLQDDYKDGFQILSSYVDKDIQSHSLYEDRDKIFKLNKQISELEKSKKDSGTELKILKLYTDLVKKCSHALAVELVQKKQYEAFFSPQNVSHDYVCGNVLQDSMNGIRASQDELKKKYIEKYGSRIRSTEVRAIEVKKRKN